jgi:hypothetical protein
MDAYFNMVDCGCCLVIWEPAVHKLRASKHCNGIVKTL